jgi:hypothetical protein
MARLVVKVEKVCEEQAMEKLTALYRHQPEVASQS